LSQRANAAPEVALGLQRSWLIPARRALRRHAGAEGGPNEIVNI